MSNAFSRLYSWAKSLVRGRYDAAQTSDENKEHWKHADSLSGTAANDPGTRKVLRERCRYECSNNSILKGLVATLAHDLIGTGPRLFIGMPPPDTGSLTGADAEARRVELDAIRRQRRAAARTIAAEFAKWAKTIDLADKLRVMHESRVRDGECFGLFTTNPKNWPKTPVLLDLRTIETEQVTTPFLPFTDPLRVDGITFDEHGNPTAYDILKQHPGSNTFGSGWWQADQYPADRVVHWFRPDRPGQARGVPEITASLSLFAQLRRYTLAVVTAAETAASFAGVLKTNNPAEYGVQTLRKPEYMDEFPLSRGMLLTLPGVHGRVPTISRDAFDAAGRLRRLAVQGRTTNGQLRRV